MIFNEDDLQRAFDAYVGLTLENQDGGSDDGETLAEMGFTEMDISDEAKKAMRLDVTAFANAVGDDVLELLTPERLAEVLWFDRSCCDGSSEGGLPQGVGERLSRLAEEMGGLDLWPAGDTLFHERTPPFEAKDSGDEMREAALARISRHSLGGKPPRP